MVPMNSPEGHSCSESIVETRWPTTLRDRGTVGDACLVLFLFFIHLTGIALAKGFFNTLFAMFTPYSFYIVVHAVLERIGLLS